MATIVESGPTQPGRLPRLPRLPASPAEAVLESVPDPQPDGLCRGRD